MTNTAANASEVRTCIERALDEYVDKALNVLVDCEEKQRTIDVLQQNEKRIESACTELRKELSDLQTKCSTLASRCESVSEKSTAGLTDQKTETELRKRLKEATDSLYAAKNEALQRRRKFDIMQLVSDNQKLKIDEMAHRMREFQHQKQMQDKEKLGKTSQKSIQNDFYKNKCEELTCQLKKMERENDSKNDMMEVEEVEEIEEVEEVEELMEVVEKEAAAAGERARIGEEEEAEEKSEESEEAEESEESEESEEESLDFK